MKANQRVKNPQSDQQHELNRKKGSHYSPEELKKVNEQIRLLKQVNKDIHSLTHYNNQSNFDEKEKSRRGSVDQDQR